MEAKVTIPEIWEEHFPELLEGLDLETVEVDSERRIRARCKNHDDNDPSLTLEIRDKDDGEHLKVVFFCHPCGEDAQEEIRESLGLPWRVFDTAYKNSRGQRKMMATAHYDYTGPSGELLYRVTRMEDGAGNKEFPVYHPNPDGGTDPGPGPIKVPFNLRRVQEAIRKGEVVIHVEGEKDVINGEIEVGHCFTTNPGGAENFSDELVPHFIGADVVHIPDNDAKGKQGVLTAAAKLLPVAKRVRMLELPVLGEKEDLTDWIRRYGGTRERFDELLETAQVFTSEMKDAGEDLGFVRFADRGPAKPREYVIGTIMPAKHVTMIYGAGGVTKSYLSLMIAVSIAAGRRSVLGYPIQKPGPAVYGDFELDIDEQHLRVEQVCEGLGIKVPRNLQYISGTELGAKEVFRRLNILSEREPVGVVVLDSLAYAMAGFGYDISNPNDTLSFYGKATNPLRANDVTPLLVHHQARQISGERYNGKDPFGSVYHRNNARSILQVEKRKGDQDGDGLLLRLHPHKRNLDAEGITIGQRVRFRDEKVTFEDWEVPEDDTGEDGGTLTTADRIKATMKDGPKTKVEIGTLTGIPEGTVHNNLTALKDSGEVIKLDQKLGRKDLFALRGGPYERPPEPPPDPDGRPAEDEESVESPGNDRGASEDPAASSAPSPNGKVVVEEPACPPNTLGDQVGRQVSSAPIEDPADAGVAGHVAETDEEVLALIETFSRADRVGLDLETGPIGLGLDTARCTPGVMSLATPEQSAVIQLTKISDDVVTELLDSLKHKTLIGHNFKYDLRVLRHYCGYEHEGPVQDTYILKRMLHFADGERKKEKGKLKVPEAVPNGSLEALVEDLFDEKLDKSQRGSNWLAKDLTEEQVAYARADTEVLFRVWDELLVEYRRVLRETAAANGRKIEQDAVLDLEGNFLPALTWMEANGFAINTAKWRELAGESAASAGAAEQELLRIASEAGLEEPEKGWNIGSDMQMIQVLEALDADLSGLDKTPKGERLSLAGDSIKKVKGPEVVQRFVELHQERKKADKNASTYGRKWLLSPEDLRAEGFDKNKIPEHQMVIDGRVRSNFKQIVRSGRLGSGSPNLQNLPSAKKTDHRAALEPPAGRVLVIADYKQIELVVAAILTGDEKMLAALKDPKRDLHTEMAEELGKDRDSVKAVNFGRLYLRGAASISKKDGIPQDEAKEIIKSYDARWQGIKAWHSREAEKTEKGIERTTTMMGRVRKISLSPKWGQKDTYTVDLPEWLAHQVQGSAGDGIKAAMTRLYQDRNTFPGNILLVDAVHDELVVECDEVAAKEVAERLEKLMISAMREALDAPDAPVRVKIKTAYDYSAVKEVEDA